ncbi:MAG: tRNA (adenosine(37)-N6)-threonylcarbamoyltransferase complex transferase subunit TsaD [Patescibacteria group bacterium]
MKILSIETSCDDTGITIMEVKGGAKNASFKVLANGIISQNKTHAPHGGVFPALAKRDHIKNLPILLDKMLKKAKLGVRQDLTQKSIDLIAVTSGPGLEPCLWTGIVFAQELSKKWNVPVVPVNHMEGHILSVFGKSKGGFIVPIKPAKGRASFPMISLLASGGNTQLVLIKDWGKYEIVGETLDDAAGEAYDKVARMMGLPYPGGPWVSRYAEKGRANEGRKLLKSIAQAGEPSIAIRQQADMRGFQKLTAEITLPRPMLYSKNLDFSFSGLKTAVLYLIKKIGPLDEEKKIQIAMEFENAVVETLIYKTNKAMEKYGASTLIVAGGVSANKHLRKMMRKFFKKEKQVLFPEKKISTDNALMIGIAGYLQYIKNNKKTIDPKKIKANGKMRLC